MREPRFRFPVERSLRCVRQPSLELTSARPDVALSCRSWPGGTVRPPTADPPRVRASALSWRAADSPPTRRHPLATPFSRPSSLSPLRGSGAFYERTPSPGRFHLTYRPERCRDTGPIEDSPRSHTEPCPRTIPAGPIALRAANSWGGCAPDGPEFRAASGLPHRNALSPRLPPGAGPELGAVRRGAWPRLSASQLCESARAGGRIRLSGVFRGWPLASWDAFRRDQTEAHQT